MAVISNSELAAVRDSLARTSLHDRIVHELGLRIVGGEFGAGDLLPAQPVLSQELGVSRNVLREAIKVLARKGLVEVRTKTGTRIRPRSEWSLLDREVLDWMAESGSHLHHILDLTECRLILEPKAAYLAARRATDEEIVGMEQAYDELEACIGRPAALMARVDQVFHRRILAASHNDVLIRLGSLIASQVEVQVVATTVDDEALRLGLTHHRALVSAIADHDPDAAEAASRTLVLSPYTELADSNELDPARRLD